MSIDQSTVDAVVDAVKQSRKYGDTSEITIRQLAEEAVAQHKKSKAAEKAVRKRLHSIMAPYLGDPDYDVAARRLDDVFATGDRTLIDATCYDIQYAHLSTRERQPLLDTFYRDIFAITGPPRRLLDLGCGLNPLAFPWMDLPPTTEFLAYDIHEPRIDFINHYFALEGLEPLARVQDIALEPPSGAG